jgi:hypothetical protein
MYQPSSGYSNNRDNRARSDFPTAPMNKAKTHIATSANPPTSNPTIRHVHIDDTIDFIQYNNGANSQEEDEDFFIEAIDDIHIDSIRINEEQTQVGLVINSFRYMDNSQLTSDEQLLFCSREQPSNNHLIYLPVRVEAATLENSESLLTRIKESHDPHAVILDHRQPWQLHPMSQVQLDGGGATSIIGEKCIKALGGLLFKSNVTISTANETAASFAVQGRTALILHITGNKTDGTQATVTMRIFAQVIPHSSQGLLLGADVLDRHRMIIDRMSKQVTLFKDTPHQLQLAYQPLRKLQENIN